MMHQTKGHTMIRPLIRSAATIAASAAVGAAIGYGLMAIAIASDGDWQPSNAVTTCQTVSR